jgi:DNA modification methylase
MFDIEYRPEWGALATFIPNKKAPIYNWFYYKEGFSKELVDKFIELFNIESGQTVFDPFCGSGTTLLACRQLGINSIGYDVLPISVFASTVKTRNYDKEELRAAALELFKNKFEKPIKKDVPPIIRRSFNKYAIEDMLFFRRHIMKLEPMTRDFLLLGLIKASMNVSWAWKDGGVIKTKKRGTIPLRPVFRHVVKRMIKDIDESRNVSTIVKYADSRVLDLEDNSIDSVITSPPYLNNIDYTKIYSIENWFVHDILDAPEHPIRSYIGSAADAEFMPELPPQARAYFKDMNMVLNELHRVCKSGGHVCMVVGNAYFTDMQVIIESDLILAELAEKIGFDVEKIIAMNQRAALEDRTRKVGTLRESAIMLRK